jgi:hypothetical protein
MKQKTMHLALWTRKFINVSVSGRNWSMVLHTNIHYTPTILSPILSFLFSFLPLQQYITIFQKYLDSDLDKTQVLTSLDMNCTILGLIAAMLRTSSTAKFCAGVCTSLNILFTFQVQDAFHATSHSWVYEHYSCPQHEKISDNICFSPAYYPMRAC